MICLNKSLKIILSFHTTCIKHALTDEPIILVIPILSKNNVQVLVGIGILAMEPLKDSAEIYAEEPVSCCNCIDIFV